MDRNATLDHARLLAAFGIVLFHSGAPGSALGYAALPFFLMLMIVMSGPVGRRSSFGDFAGGRATRLLGPWLIWSAVYGGLKLTEVAVTGKPLASEFEPWMLLTGPAMHLWFLPFALVASLAAWPLLRRSGPSFGPALVLTGLGVLGLGADQGQIWVVPVAQWVHVLPALGLGLGLALVAHNRQTTLRHGLPLVALFAGAALAAGWTTGLGQIVLAALAVIACLVLPLPETRASRVAAATALGVYLSHPLVMSVLERTTNVAPQSLALAGLTAAGAFGIAWMLLSAPKAAAPRLHRASDRLRPTLPLSNTTS